MQTHHKKIDTPEFVNEYPPERLRELKRRHEERIEFVTSVGDENKSHVLLYGANIAQQNNPVDLSLATKAMLPEMYPAEKTPIRIHLVGSTLTDDKTAFWASMDAKADLPIMIYDRNRTGLNFSKAFQIG